MFRKVTDRISAAAASVLNSASNTSNNSNNNNNTDSSVSALVAMGFDAQAASIALQAAHGDVDRATEWLVSQNASSNNNDNNNNNHHHNNNTSNNTNNRNNNHPGNEDEDATMQRILQESLELEEHRRRRLPAQPLTTTAAVNPSRSAAVHKAGQAAAWRAAGGATTTTTNHNQTNQQQQQQLKQKQKQQHQLIPKLQDKPKEEQIVRCADRLKASPQAVDTLLRALMAVRDHPDEAKYRKIDTTSAGYQRSLANAPGATDLLRAMNYYYYYHDPSSSQQAFLILDRAMVDPALLYLGISALEQTRLTPEYQMAKQKIVFHKTVQEILASADASETEALARAAYMAQCPTEPPEGRGSYIQVKLGTDTMLRRRFDADDTLADVLHWLGGHGSVIPNKLLSREWSLLDVNQPQHQSLLLPLDCQAHQHHTLQYIGCWPSGRLEIVPSTTTTSTKSSSSSSSLSTPHAVGKMGSSRGLGAAPSDAL